MKPGEPGPPILPRDPHNTPLPRASIIPSGPPFPPGLPISLRELDLLQSYPAPRGPRSLQGPPYLKGPPLPRAPHPPINPHLPQAPRPLFCSVTPAHPTGGWAGVASDADFSKKAGI